MRVAVVGGGITGLAAAHALATRPDPPEVVLYEADDRLGGKIATAEFCGVPVERGPDTMLARVPWAVDLCRRLGLADRLVSPATGAASVWARGRLRPLPEGLVLGVPARLGPLVRGGILSVPGLARAGLDLVLPRWPGRGGDDPSIAEAIGRRFGPEVVERLVEPLLSGINAGRADGLSLAATAPDVAAAAAGGRSLLLGLRRRPAAPPGPVFVSLPGGLSTLVQALATALVDRGVDIRTGTRLTGLPADADAVIVTVPAPAAAALLAVEELRAIAYAGVAVVTMAYPDDALTRPLVGSGFLVPRAEGWLLTAGTFVSSKWPALKPPGLTLVRASTGRAGDDRWAGLDDATLAARLHDELARALALRRPPVASRVDRWPASFPQYAPGHLARVDRIEAALPAGVVVAGAAYRGVGIAACIRQGEAAAARVLQPPSFCA
jgi:protoporphyrinogen/coproporphyrinogen III oxidase